MRPFCNGDTFSTFRNYIDKISKEIKNLDNEYILKASQTELEDYYIEKSKIRPLLLHTDQYYIENQKGVSIDVRNDFRRGVPQGERAIVRGTCLEIAIPYEGDQVLWEIRASTFSLSGYPEIEVKDDRIILSISFPDDNVESTKIKSEIDRSIKSLTEAVQNLKKDVDNHNNTAPQTIKSSVQRKFNLARSTIGAVSALGIPIKRRDKPLTYTVPTIRRDLSIKKPSVSTEPYKSEPVLDEAEYQHILEVMRSMSLVIERSPASFITLDEEAIRTHFLLQLNGHYEGGASGETFNVNGKTDILIRAENRNIFIAECKFWRGQKAFNEAIDQILGYLSWRDTKCALLIFNKLKDTTAVRDKMNEVMTERHEYRRTISQNIDGDSRYIFVKEEDPGREIIITTQLYDIPV